MSPLHLSMGFNCSDCVYRSLSSPANSSSSATVRNLSHSREARATGNAETRYNPSSFSVRMTKGQERHCQDKNEELLVVPTVTKLWCLHLLLHPPRHVGKVEGAIEGSWWLSSSCSFFCIFRQLRYEHPAHSQHSNRFPEVVPFLIPHGELKENTGGGNPPRRNPTRMGKREAVPRQCKQARCLHILHPPSLHEWN